MTVESTIDYEGLAQEAMRGVVRKVLARTAKSGLAGDHHFYISFDTEAPGVSLSRRLKEKYPHEMTIVLQHRFWDLIVSEERFEVKLTFDGIPERLVVPFDAIKVFFDPSVRFGLQFEDPHAGPEARAQSAGSSFEGLSTRGGAGRATHTRKSPRTRKAQSEGAGAKPAATNGEASIPPLPDDAALKVVGGSGMAYEWATGSEYGCRYELSASHGEITRVASGMVTYQPTAVDPATVRLERDDPAIRARHRRSDRHRQALANRTASVGQHRMGGHVALNVEKWIAAGATLD